MAKNTPEIFDFFSSAFLPGSRAAVVDYGDSIGFLDDTKSSGITVSKPKIRPSGAKDVEFMPWGDNNNLPVEILEKVHANVTVASNVEFNASLLYGEGIMVAKKVRGADGNITFQECLESEYPDVFEWLRDNNYTRIIQECANDLVVFSKAYAELILGRTGSKSGQAKLAIVRAKEMTCSRVSRQNPKTGRIDYHGYSGKWHGSTEIDDCIVTELLDEQSPVFDLKVRLGLKYDPETGTKKRITSENRFIIPLSLPVPGRFYYNKSFWWSIFKSGWYDFACYIPRFKRALLKNKATFNYTVEIHVRFWDKLFAAEGIAQDDIKKRQARRRQFLQEMDDFLSGVDNAGKSFISEFNYDKMKGYEERDVIIRPVESAQKGGEFVEDSEEASNIICYAMSVHPSLRGASPGKNKNINGTEARELFIIKQAMTKPLRDLLLLPAYIAKELNGWDRDLHFVIPNIMLTTLDKNTGAEKVIGNEKV
ncbi:MAG: hypothetical protein LBJ72_11885 [Dysgonamonadaceae bacterium]|jgi:hypothetical protein|nr:hypothetical protein [Dysgonamonadaceae bacterium]